MNFQPIELDKIIGKYNSITPVGDTFMSDEFTFLAGESSIVVNQVFSQRTGFKGFYIDNIQLSVYCYLDNGAGMFEALDGYLRIQIYSTGPGGVLLSTPNCYNTTDFNTTQLKSIVLQTKLNDRTLIVPVNQFIFNNTVVNDFYFAGDVVLTSILGIGAPAVGRYSVCIQGYLFN